MRLYLVRHGQTPWNVLKKWQGTQDINLNETGIAQAIILAKKLTEYEIDIIYSSPLSRAKTTSEIIQKKINKDLKINKGLEEINFGSWENNTLEELENKYKDSFLEWDLCHAPHSYKEHGVEGFKELQERSFITIEEICKNNYKSALIVTHGTWIRALVCKLMDIPIENKRCFQIENCTITTLDYCKDTRDFKVISLNA